VLAIHPEPVDSPAARALTGALDAYLAARYPALECFADLPAAQVSQGHGVFVVGRVAERAVACGAVRLLPGGLAEVKRMWVDPSQRGHGWGRAVLLELERWAAGRGADRLVLETGNLQVEALRLYWSSGYAEIPCFGAYAASPSSICFEKRLVAP
jgi:putative acetyltransferase